jgi:RHS repeat-associated protein
VDKIYFLSYSYRLRICACPVYTFSQHESRRMSNKSGISDQIITLPQGGGALKGLGEKFTPDLHTGTGNFSVPLALPPGRNGFQPQLSLVYSTGQGQGPFGLGWNIGLPHISRKTSKGVPHYNEQQDVFILSGAEDLVPVDQGAGYTRYRPRTEGLFALITHYVGSNGDYWEVHAKDGLLSRFGTPRPAAAPAGWQDPAVVGDSAQPGRIFTWSLSETRDSYGNRIIYEYEPDTGSDGPRPWSQTYLRRVRYVDYTAPNGDEAFLVSVTVVYEALTDAEPFSDYRAGFEIRTRRRCSSLEVRTHPGTDQLVRTYTLSYFSPGNGASLLRSLTLTGHDQGQTESMPPLEFKYTDFAPESRDFFPLSGSLPPQSLAHSDYELVDLFGNGLPDIMEMNGVIRYWRNLGHGQFAEPREMANAPAGLRLAESGVQFLDATGDGRPDLLVTQPGLSGYFSLNGQGEWDTRSFQAYGQAPSFDLEDAEVRLVDLDGDGVTDALRTGERLEHFFQEPGQGWTRLVAKDRGPLENFPNVYFSDPCVRLADMNGDGLQDIVLLGDGRVDYWPNLGRGQWGRRVTMRQSPRLPGHYDPRRLLVGDVDGDGAADMVYVEDAQVSLWLNRQGEAWSEPVVIHGTPSVSDMDAVRLADMLGTGMAGILWSKDVSVVSPERYCFLDLTGGIKPYVLKEVDNNLGAVIRVRYASSIAHYLRDEQKPTGRWQTSLPFPVQVVEKVEVSEYFSGNTLSTEYQYHHGAWDGGEREFRGFGRAEQLDSERFAASALAGQHYSPPTLTKTWFYQGPLGDEFGAWQSPDFSREYWAEDLAWYPWVEGISQAFAGLPRRALRDALRSLRSSVLRTELYGLDQSGREGRPYTVMENTFGLREEAPPAAGEANRSRIFFPHQLIQRTTEWERGDDPLTRVVFTNDYTAWGLPQQQTSVALPRRSSRCRPITASVVGTVDVDKTRILATHARTEFAKPDPGLHLRQRVAHMQIFELAQPPGVVEADPADLARVLRDQAAAALALSSRFHSDLQSWRFGQPLPSGVRLLHHTLYHYDGPAYQGRLAGEVGPFGALTRTEILVTTGQDLDAAYLTRRPDYLGGSSSLPPGAPTGFGSDLGYRLQAPASGGYHAGYYADQEKRKYDFQTPALGQQRGVVVGVQDPLGHESAVTPDAYGLLPERVRDAAGLETQAEYNYAVMLPRRVEDQNGQQVHFSFTPLGLLRHQYLQGRDGEGGTAAKPEVALRYDFAGYQRTRQQAAPQPIYIHTTRRLHHAQDQISDETLESREYSDGLSRSLQMRSQAGELLLGAQGDDAGLPFDPAQAPAPGQGHRSPGAVTVTGWQVYDSKSRVVEKYEPFFGAGWDFQPEAESRRGQHVAMEYDPRGHLIRILNPNGSEQRILFGAPAQLDTPAVFFPTPWESYMYDANDLAPVSYHPTEKLADGSPKPLTQRAPVGHHFTPTHTVSDALGRVVAQVQRNGRVPQTDFHLTRSGYDLRGNLLTAVDTLGRTAFRHAYDLLNRPLLTESLDAGTRTSVLNALGNPAEYRDSKGSLVLRTYDVLNRLQGVWAQDQPAGSLTQREQVIYGDAGDPGQPTAERQAQRAQNRLGRSYQHFDEAGLLQFERYDFKGNLSVKHRRVVSDQALAAGWQADWSQTSAANALEAGGYETSMRYDALNRPHTLQCPSDTQGGRAQMAFGYNQGGALERVTLDGQDHVRQIAYNAKGQRLLAVYGNNVMTRYAYDPQTFRLARLRSEALASNPAPDTWAGSGRALQDLSYVYDLVGNLDSLEERTPGCGVAQNGGDRDRLQRTFAYDPLYRLLEASGRVCQATSARPWEDLPDCGTYSGSPAVPNQDNGPDLTERYKETYAYDPAGNLLSLGFLGGTQWTREFGLGGLQPGQWAQSTSNRLTSMQAGQQILRFEYDANGNLWRQNTEREYHWDHADRLQGFTLQPAGAAQASVEVRYLYDPAGLRVKKWVKRHTDPSAETMIYVDGYFEHHRWQENGAPKTNILLHLLDGQQRLTVIRRGDIHPGDAGPGVQYHLPDHLGSSSVVVDHTGAWANREEYTPYGETTFGGFAKKRFRFTGKERDEETGCYYHGARYYAPWLGRWISCDPAGHVDGLNAFLYSADNPLRYVDPAGREGEEAADKEPAAGTHVILVGSDAKSYAPDAAGNSVEIVDSHGFHNRVQALLSTSTEERFPDRVKPGDNIVVLVPTSINPSVIKDLEAYGKKFKKDFAEQHPSSPGVTFEIKKLHGRDVAKALNDMKNIQTLFYFGHGEPNHPLFEYTMPDRTLFADPAEFKAESFAPNAVAVWGGCNSWKFAEAFTKQTGTTSIGIEGLGFYAVPSIGIRAARKGFFDDSRADMWMYFKAGDQVTKVGPLNFSGFHPEGIPILHPKPAATKRDPFEPPWPHELVLPRATPAKKK